MTYCNITAPKPERGCSYGSSARVPKGLKNPCEEKEEPYPILILNVFKWGSPQDRNFFCQSGLNAMYALLAPQWADILESAEAREDWGTLDHSHSSFQEMCSATPSSLRTHTECRFHQISLIFHCKLLLLCSTLSSWHFSLPYSWWCKSKDWAWVLGWCKLLSPFCQRRKWMEVGHTWICRGQRTKPQ